MPMAAPWAFRNSIALPMTIAFIAVSLDQLLVVSMSSHQEAGVAFCERAYAAASCAALYPELRAWQAWSSMRQLPAGPESASSASVPTGDLRFMYSEG